MEEPLSLIVSASSLSAIAPGCENVSGRQDARYTGCMVLERDPGEVP